MDQHAEKRKDRKSTRTRQKNKRGDNKVESNDSAEIPDRWKTSEKPSLLPGGLLWHNQLQQRRCGVETTAW